MIAAWNPRDREAMILNCDDFKGTMRLLCIPAALHEDIDEVEAAVAARNRREAILSELNELYGVGQSAAGHVSKSTRK